ncbi:MAG: hypothetical protein KDE14_12370 [Rhodobacteraceae bacterium]|nr:hypothetical protein [Paracoccaceae bacterium]
MTNLFSRYDLGAAQTAAIASGAAVLIAGVVAVAGLPWVGLAFCIAAAVASGLVVVAINRNNAKIDTCIEVARAAADGQLDARVVMLQASGAPAKLADALNRLLDLTEAFTKEAHAAMEYANRRRYFRKIIPTGLRGNFIYYAETINHSLDLMSKRDAAFNKFVADNVIPVATMVASAANDLTKNSDTISRLSAETQQQSGAASDGANSASENVQSVATAMEEFSASISEINTQISRAASVAGDAVSAVSRTDETMRSLTDAANKIGSVIVLINDIAERTNLLALNATIEAARAGEAGKGFAVVAGEVKALAAQTAKATHDISSQVKLVQSVVGEASGTIADVVKTVQQIQDSAAVVAGAIEEQTAVTSEVVQNITRAAEATGTVSSAVSAVDHAANQALLGTSEVARAASSLAESSAKLRAEIDSFTSQMAAG